MTTQTKLRSAQLTSQEASLRASNLQQQLQNQINKSKTQQYQEQNTGVQDRVNSIIKDINEGKISSYEEIPTDLRQYVSVDSSYFQQKKEYQQLQAQAQAEQARYNDLLLAEKFAKKGLSAIYVKNLSKEAQEYFRDIKQGIRAYAEAPKTQVGYFVDGVGMSSVPELAPATAKPQIVYATGKQAGRALPSGVQYLNREVLASYTPVNKPLPLNVQQPRLESSTVLQSTNNLDVVRNPQPTKNPPIYMRVKNIFFGKKQFKNEVYDPKIGAFVSASPTGADSTALIRQPTIEEREVIETAQIKGSYAELPPIKFLSGGYGWQQEFDKKNAEKKATQKDILGLNAWLQSQRRGDLKDIPYSPQGFAPTGTNLFFEGTGQITRGLTKLGIDTSSKVRVPKKTAQDIFLTASLFAFDPLIRTGAVAKKVKTSQLSENRFSQLGKELDSAASAKVQEFYQGVRTEIVKKKAGEEQLKTLDKIYKEFFKGKKGGKEDFKVLVRKLYEEGEFKGVPVDYMNKPPQEKLTIVLDIDGLPQMKGAGIFTSSSNVINIEKKDQEGFQLFSLSEPSQKEFTETISQSKFNVLGNKQTNKTTLTLLGGLVTKQKSIQKPKQQELTKQIPKQIELLRTQQKTKQKSSQVSRTQLRELLRQKTPQKTKEIITTPKPPKVRPPLPPLKSSSIPATKQEKGKKLSTFEVFLKRFGEDKPIFKGTSKKKAEDILKRALTGTLGRSGKIFEDGEALPFDKFNFGKMFRPSKKDSSRIVQKAQFSLGSRGEISEIQLFKRKSDKKKKGFSWFS